MDRSPKPAVQVPHKKRSKLSLGTGGTRLGDRSLPLIPMNWKQ